MRRTEQMCALKELIWIGSSRADLKAFPSEVQDAVGYGLYQAQLGLLPAAAKVLRGFKGVVEIVCDFDKNAYRSVYATKIGNKIYVLHTFQKKSKSGIKTPREDMLLVRRRLQTAKKIAENIR